jgi:hypothetical protein
MRPDTGQLFNARKVYKSASRTKEICNMIYSAGRLSLVGDDYCSVRMGPYSAATRAFSGEYDSWWLGWNIWRRNIQGLKATYLDLDTGSGES